MNRESISRLPLLMRSLAVLTLVALVAAGVVAGPKLVGAQSAGEVMVVNTDALNLRANASLSADVIAVLATGESVTVVDGPVSADGYDWYEVSADEGDGWVDGEYLNDTLTYTSSGSLTGESLVVDTDVLNLRSDASIDADVIAQMVAGDAVTVLDGPISADGYGWYQVSTDDGTGWVAGEYLGATVTLAASSGFSAGDAVLVDTDALNLRADATIDADVLAVLETGATGTIVDGPVSADGYTWYEISTDAGTGWVDAEYLSFA